MDGLFPSLPKDITALSDEELKALLDESLVALTKVKEDDPKYLEGLSADDIISQLEAGTESIKTLRAETQARVDAAEAFQARKDELIAGTEEPEVKAEAEDDDAAKDDDEDEAAATAKSDDEAAKDDDEDAAGAEAGAEGEVKDPVRELVTADASVEPEKPRLRRAPPAPAADRVVVEEKAPLAFVASGLVPSTVPGTKFESRSELSDAISRMAKAVGSPSKSEHGREERYMVASLDYSENFPEERTLHSSDWQANAEKIKAVGSPYLGDEGIEALVASGGFCAPLEPIYTMPQLASRDRPVRDALPNFRAQRGGINVPTPTTIGDAAGAITVITAAEDELGGTFATKACLDMDCPDYSEYAVTVISHCREFGNLNAMAWPEKIAHENELTMAEHARIAEGYILGQIKALSLKVSSGAETLGALIYLMDAITKSQYGIRSRLRLPNEARFTALLPRVALDILLLDTIQTQFDRYRSRADVEAYLASVGVDVTWYMDTPLLGNGVGTDGPSMIADAAQGDQAALEAFPDVIQWGLFPAGTFLHLDMAELNLGIVRDSTLNSTNDFQIFGETFENVARIGPQQAAYWETTDICAVGTFPPAGTARTCD
jgi:hypothetical protein